MHIKDILSKVNNEKNAIIIYIIVFVLLTMISWNKYGIMCSFDFQRELMVPYLISKGYVLYKDIFYFYCPLVPYFIALLVIIFGYSLSLFYVYGLIFTFIYGLILYFLARQFLNAFAASIVSVLFLSQLAFYELGPYIFPYSYSASIGVFLSTLLVIFLIMHYKNEKICYLSAAMIITFISLFVKQDFLITCILIFLVYFFILPFNKLKFDKTQSIKDKIYIYIKNLKIINIIKYLAMIIIPAGLVYLGLINYFGAKTLKEGLYPIGILSSKESEKFTIILSGEITLNNFINIIYYALGSFLIISLTILLIYSLLKVSTFLKERFGNKAKFIVILIFLTLIMVLNINIINDDSLLLLIILFIIKAMNYPYAGINLWIIIFLIYMIFYNRNEHKYTLIFLALSAIIQNYRMFFLLKLYFYAYFYLPLSILVFVYILMELIPILITRLTRLSKHKWLMATRIFLIIFSIAYILMDASIFNLIRHKVETPIGIFYARDKDDQSKYLLMEHVSKYIKDNTTDKDKILALPDINMIYFFSNRLPASKYYSCTPGTFYSKEEDRKFINEIKNKNPKYILISSNLYFNKNLKKYNSYSSGRFKLEFPAWIKDNYHLEQTFKTKILKDQYWKIWVYRKK